MVRTQVRCLYCPLPRAPGVWPCARPCALLRPHRERFHGRCVGRPAVLDPVGWGNTAAYIPAGGGPVRGCASPPGPRAAGRCAKPVRSVFERVLVTSNWLKIVPGVSGADALTMGVEGALGGQGARCGGAFASTSRLPGRQSAFAGEHPRGRIHGSTCGSAAAPRRALHGSMGPVRTVHWLSPACGGVDAVVGGVEQRRRGGSRDRRRGRLRRRHRVRRRDRAAGRIPAVVGRSRPPVGGRRLAPRRGARRHGGPTDPDRGPRHLRCERRAVAGRAVRGARGRVAASDGVAGELHGRRPGRTADHRLR